MHPFLKCSACCDRSAIPGRNIPHPPSSLGFTTALSMVILCDCSTPCTVHSAAPFQQQPLKTVPRNAQFEWSGTPSHRADHRAAEPGLPRAVLFGVFTPCGQRVAESASVDFEPPERVGAALGVVPPEQRLSTGSRNPPGRFRRRPRARTRAAGARS